MAAPGKRRPSLLAPPRTLPRGRAPIASRTIWSASGAQPVNGNPSRSKDTSHTSVVPEGRKPKRAAWAEATAEGLVPQQAGDRATPGDADVPAAGSAGTIGASPGSGWGTP